MGPGESGDPLAGAGTGRGPNRADASQTTRAIGASITIGSSAGWYVVISAASTAPITSAAKMPRLRRRPSGRRPVTSPEMTPVSVPVR